MVSIGVNLCFTYKSIHHSMTHNQAQFIDDLLKLDRFHVSAFARLLARMDAIEEAKKRIVDEGMRGGLGILLMSRCADRLHYAGFGNILRLEKNISVKR